MQWLKKVGKWLADQIIEELNKPMIEMQNCIKKQGEEISAIKADIQAMKENDEKQLGYDLAFGENSLCHHINRALLRGYMTADERRNIPNMYKHYCKLGGNHGAELAFSKFSALPTQEEYERQKEELGT